MSNPGLISKLLNAMLATKNNSSANAFANDLLRLAEDIEIPFAEKRQGRITLSDPEGVLETQTSLFTFDEIKVEYIIDSTVLTLGTVTLVLETIEGGTDGEYTTVILVEDCGDPIGVTVDVRLERVKTPTAA